MARTKLVPSAPTGAGARRARSTGRTDSTAARRPQKPRNKKLIALSKTFGDIPGVPIFSTWESRKQCSQAGVHRPWMAGIYGNGREGTFSIVLSNSYKDDKDDGDTIIYTGAGGRMKYNKETQRHLRIGPQTEDQTWKYSANQALERSCMTGNPVRVVRSSKCPSKYAPKKPFRYDGLYKIVRCWGDKGINGKEICRCELQRLPGQAELPERGHEYDSDAAGETDHGSNEDDQLAGAENAENEAGGSGEMQA